MRLQKSVICASALLASSTIGQNIPNKPNFSPAAIKAPFVEQFTDDWTSRWTPSHAQKEDSPENEEWAYTGEWSVEEPTVYPGIIGDKGLVVKNAAAHHAISAKFNKPINNKGKTLVVQYEVKLQNGLECGGAYMKLLQDNKALASEEFSNTSPYVIMFGPDKCGSTNKVHFIFKHKNPKTGEYEEKHLKAPPPATISKTTTLYTLIVKPDNTFDLLIDTKSVKSGSLLEDFSPPVNPEKEIDDADDKKPEDWVDLARMPDPEATKPADWDEDAPNEIIDTEAEKPEDWLEDEPLTIPDPEAEKPEDWDDEEDGDWIPPQVPNPKCEEAAGCGKWEPPMIKNPDYKGKWTAPHIDNPLYKGPWAPRKIANPAYFEDKTPANFEPMGAIGFEIWTMQNNILFDNIYIGHSIEDAAALAKQTFEVKSPLEKAEENASAPEEPEIPEITKGPSFKDDPVTFVKTQLDLFITLAKKDPVQAIKFMPEVAGAIGVGIVTIVGILLLAIGGGAAAAPSKEQVKRTVEKTKENAKKTAENVKEAATDAKDKVVDAAASGTEAAKAEVNKRTTRSSQNAE